MRHLYICFLLLILSLSTISAQNILDKLDYTYIDVIVGEETITEFIATGNGDCSNAIAHIYRNDSLLAIKYIGSPNQFLYEIVDDRWYVMSRLLIDDVIQPNGYNIYFFTQENTIDSYTNDNFIEEDALATDITDFTVSRDTIYFLEHYSDSIVAVDLYGNKVNEYLSPPNATKITFYNNQFYIISKDSINIYNGDMKPKYAVPNDANYHDYRLINDTLYFISDDKIGQLSNENVDAIATLEDFSDFKIEGDTIYYIIKDDMLFENLIYAQSLPTGNKSVVSEIDDPLKVTSFAKGRTSDIVYGYYQTPSLRPLGVRCDISEINKYGLQASIEIISVDYHESTPNSQPKTKVEFVVTNYSFGDINNYVYQTDTYGGINCAEARYAEEINTNLSSSSSDTLNREYVFNAIDDEFCINLLSINGRYDYVDLDNRDCKTITSIDKIKKDENLRIYPNPASNEIYINYEHEIIEIKVFDINGRSIITGSNGSLDISNLSPGVYNVQLKTFSGELIMRRFTKI